MKLFKRKNKAKDNIKTENEGVNYHANDVETNNNYRSQKIFKSLDENLEYIKKYQSESWDFVSNEIILINDFQNLKVGVVYFAGLVDQTLLNDVITEVINKNFKYAKHKLNTSDEIFNYFKYHILTMVGDTFTENYEKLFNNLLSGDLILLIDGVDKALILGARKANERAVEKPVSQLAIMGSNDAFNENNLTNISLVRKRVKNPNFIVKNYILGRESNTNVGMAYIKGIVDENVLKEVKARIEAIDIPTVLNSLCITNEIADEPFSIFPRIYYSERPDNVVANLFEGRIAIFIDGVPDVLVVPSLFIQFLHSTDDFQQKAILASFFRMLRFFGLLLSVYMPAIYICMVLAHSELLPVKLLDSIAGQINTTPLPQFLEVFSVMLAFDVLRESGARMPSYFGSSLSFVGAIIIGQSSVEAGLISPIVVIVVALSGVGAQLIPNYKLSITTTVLKYVNVIVAIFFGLFGLTLITAISLIHLVSLRSFGVDYMAPFAPLSKEGLEDSIIRFPFKSLFKKNRKSEQFPH